jgi:DNA polymerase-1
VAADVTGDSRMTAAYRNGEDLHTLTASLMLEKPINEITKQERQSAKAVNFGLIYSMGAAGLQQYSIQSYGVDMSIEQAERFRASFFKAYTGINEWHRKLKNNPPTEGRTLAGRKFIFSSNAGLSVLCNMPTQGTAADIVKKALGLLPDRLKETGAKIVGVVHDEIMLESAEEEAEKTAEILKTAMEEAGNTILAHIPCQADVSISTSWTKG